VIKEKIRKGLKLAEIQEITILRTEMKEMKKFKFLINSIKA